MSKSKIGAAREKLKFAEVSEHNLGPKEFIGFFAGWSIAVAGDLDLCQGVIDRLNELLSSGSERDLFAIGKLAGYVAYHSELIKLLAEEGRP